MRKAFIESLTELASKDERIFLLTGDLGFSVFEDFHNKFPERFFNVGVAEQNLIGVAAGLAMSGKIVYAYSIAPFITMRCLEQVRNDICFHNQNVRLIGVGGGLSYGSAGPTHHSIEDIAIMRALVNMTVIAPGDPVEVKEAVKSSFKHIGPIYIRLGKGNEPTVHRSRRINISKGIVIEDGKDVTVFSSAGTLAIAKGVSNALTAHKVSVRLISMPTIKPLDNNLVIDSTKRTKAIFTIEEHGLIGGLGSAVAELISETGNKIIFKRFAIPDNFNNKIIGSHKYLTNKCGLSAKQITSTILKYLDGHK